MAFDYTTFFTRLGRLVFEINKFVDDQGSYLMDADVGADDILDEFAARRDLVKGVQGAYEGFANNMQAWARRMMAYVRILIIDQQDELECPTKSVNRILELLYNEMVADSETLDRNTIGGLTVNTGASNVGTGELHIDGINPLTGINDERIIGDKITVRCMADRFSGASEGGERFEIVGGPKYSEYDGYHDRGTGSGGTMTVGDAANLLSNGTLASFTDDVPDGSWEVDSGTTGTHILEETTIVHAYDSCLELTTDGAQATIELHQDILTALKAGERIGIGVWLRKGAGVFATGSTLEVMVEGTGISNEDIFDADPDTLTTSFVLHEIFFTTPNDIPDDIKVTIKWSNADSETGKSVYLSGMVMRRPVYHNHVGMVLYRGGTDFIVDDVFDFTPTNDEAGTFQTFFGRYFNVLLPSAAGAAETIDDALAE